jgi:hypothetical protein
MSRAVANLLIAGALDACDGLANAVGIAPGLLRVHEGLRNHPLG